MPLYSMTVADGAITRIGGALHDIAELAYKSTGPVLFGFSRFNGGQLYSINPATGAPTRIGGGQLGNIRNIFYADDEDVLYGYSPLDGGSLYTINQSTGAPTLYLNRGVSGLGGFLLSAYLGTGVGLFYNGSVAVVDLISTGEVIFSLPYDSDVISFQQDQTAGDTYVLRPRNLYRVNFDESVDQIASAGLGTMRAMCFTTPGDGLLYLLG